MKVLYIHHAGPFGGASRSLLELLRAIPESQVEKYVLTKKGQFASILEKEDVKVITSAGISQFDNTRYSYYRGLRWVIILRELIYLPSTFFSLLEAKNRWGNFDIIHINDITLVPSIFFSKIIFRCPIVVHVRSVQSPLTNFRGKLLRNFFIKFVNVFVAIDNAVANSLDKILPIEVIHNGLALNTKTGKKEKAGVFTVGMVGAISKAKGCLEFIEAAKLCKQAGAKIRFVFIGQASRSKSKVRDFFLKMFGISQEVEVEIKNKITQYALVDNVEFWPFTLDLEEVYRNLDVVCFPSHFDAPGRPIFEAALCGVPSVAAISSPTSDTFVDKVTGLLIKPHDFRALSSAIMKFSTDKSFLLETGKNAKELAERLFDIAKNADRVVNLYKKILSQSLSR